MSHAAPSYFVQMPAGGGTNYAPNANAADRPFQPTIAIVLISATLLSFVALWFSTGQRRS